MRGDPGPVTLAGTTVRLEPLRAAHGDALFEAAREVRIWTWLGCDLRSAEAIGSFIEEAEAEERAGTAYPFAVVLLQSGQPERVVASTRYLDIVRASRGVEIGWTWYAPEVWGDARQPRGEAAPHAARFRGVGGDSSLPQDR